jgi:hypothetical protein
MIRENLDIERPDRVRLLFPRRITERNAGPVSHLRDHGRVIPSLSCGPQGLQDQAIPESRASRYALRNETTINNTYDFAIGRRLHNLAA